MSSALNNDTRPNLLGQISSWTSIWTAPSVLFRAVSAPAFRRLELYGVISRSRFLGLCRRFQRHDYVRSERGPGWWRIWFWVQSQLQRLVALQHCAGDVSGSRAGSTALLALGGLTFGTTTLVAFAVGASLKCLNLEKLK
jgi:hypothetical protein